MKWCAHFFITANQIHPNTKPHMNHSASTAFDSCKYSDGILPCFSVWQWVLFCFACEEPRSRWSHGLISQLFTILPDSHKNLLQNQPPESVSRARSGRSELSCPCRCQLLEAAREDREGHSGGIAKYVVPVKLDRVSPHVLEAWERNSTSRVKIHIFSCQLQQRPVHQKNLVLLRHQGRVETC